MSALVAELGHEELEKVAKFLAEAAAAKKEKLVQQLVEEAEKVKPKRPLPSPRSSARASADGNENTVKADSSLQQQPGEPIVPPAQDVLEQDAEMPPQLSVAAESTPPPNVEGPPVDAGAPAAELPIAVLPGTLIPTPGKSRSPSRQRSRSPRDGSRPRETKGEGDEEAAPDSKKPKVDDPVGGFLAVHGPEHFSSIVNQLEKQLQGIGVAKADASTVKASDA